MLWSNRYHHAMELPLSSCYGVTRILMLWSFPYPHVMVLWISPFPHVME